MRITNSMMIDNLLRNLNGNLTRVNKYSSQLSSNRRIVNLSDDPIGVMNSMNARQQIRRLNQYQSNVTTARSWAQQAESSVYEMQQTVVKMKELMVDAMGTKTESDKKNFATQIRELTEHLLQTCNSTVGDKYIFSGFNSTKAGFEAVRDENGNLTNVLYNGLDLTKTGADAVTGKRIENSTNATNYQWSGELAHPQKYTISVGATDATGTKVIFTDAAGNTVTKTVTDADAAAGTIDLGDFGTVTWKNEATAPNSEEIANAIASAGSVTTPAAAVMGPKAEQAINDNGLRWTGALNDSTQKYSIEVNGDTLVFKNSYGSQVATHQVSAADVANGFIDLSAQGLGRVEWDTAPAPDAADPADTQEQALARMIGSAEFVTSQLGEESTQDVEFEIGFNMNFDVTFTGVDIVGTGENNMFSILTQMTADLEAGKSNDELTKYLTKLTGIQDRFVSTLVESGVRTVKLDTMVNRYSMDAINYESIRSDVEDIDQAETIMNYKYCQSIFEQALASGAQIIQPTLMDFLR